MTLTINPLILKTAGVKMWTSSDKSIANTKPILINQFIGNYEFTKDMKDWLAH